MRDKFLAVALCAMCLSVTPVMQTSIVFAAEQESNLPYSRFWEVQHDGSWKYKYDNGTYATGWIHDDVDGNWYVMDENGIMQSGLYQSYGKYYLLSEEHDGHFGHMLKNGEVYKGVQIVAETSSDTEGALSEETIVQLGLDTSKAPDISGTQHVENGEVTSPTQTPTPDNTNYGGNDPSAGIGNIGTAKDHVDDTGEKTGGSGATKDIPVYGGISTDNPWGIEVGTGEVTGSNHSDFSDIYLIAN